MATMGRPRTFDRDMAITQAMHLFWEHGYESTSLSQLKAAMGSGISAPSFYAAFGSKEALFQEVVQRYQSSHGRVTESLFDTALAPREAIELTLRRSAKMQSETGHPPGCLVTLGVMHTCSAQPSAVSAPLAEARARNRAGVIACIERGIDQDELPADTDTCALAAMFDSFLMGLTALARDGIPYAVMDASVTQVMAVWDALSATTGQCKITSNSK